MFLLYAFYIHASKMKAYNKQTCPVETYTYVLLQKKSQDALREVFLGISPEVQNWREEPNLMVLWFRPPLAPAPS